MTDEDRRQILAEAFNRRLDQLGLTRAELARRASGSPKTISKIANAHQHSYQAKSVAGIEREIGWPPGTINAILNGHPPPDPDEVRVPREEERLAELEDRVQMLTQTVGDLSSRVARLTSVVEGWLRGG